MIKNFIISTLTAILVVEKSPWFSVCTIPEKVGVLVGICIPLLFFLLFLDIQVEKYQKKRARVREMRRIMEQITKGDRKIV